jgi:hypothetical protein
MKFTTESFYCALKSGIRSFINIVAVNFLILKQQLSSVVLSVTKFTHLFLLSAIFYFCGLSLEIHFPANRDDREYTVYSRSNTENILFTTLDCTFQIYCCKDKSLVVLQTNCYDFSILGKRAVLCTRLQMCWMACCCHVIELKACT